MGTSWWDIVKDFVVSLGWARGTFALFFWVAHFWIYRLYTGRLNDRQRQIDEIAKENHEYRDRFLAILDEHFGFEKRHPSSSGSEQIVKTPKQIEPEPEKTASAPKQSQVSPAPKPSQSTSKRSLPTSKDKPTGKKG